MDIYRYEEVKKMKDIVDSYNLDQDDTLVITMAFVTGENYYVNSFNALAIKYGFTEEEIKVLFDAVICVHEYCQNNP